MVYTQNFELGVLVILLYRNQGVISVFNVTNLKKSSFSNKKEIVIVPLTGQVL